MYTICNTICIQYVTQIQSFVIIVYILYDKYTKNIMLQPRCGFSDVYVFTNEAIKPFLGTIKRAAKICQSTCMLSNLDYCARSSKLRRADVIQKCIEDNVNPYKPFEIRALYTTDILSVKKGKVASKLMVIVGCV